MLRGPGWVRKAAASQARDPVERWMLGQPRHVRASYVREVIDRGGHPALAEIWMLRQPDAVRESYVKEILEPNLPANLRRDPA